MEQLQQDDVSAFVPLYVDTVAQTVPCVCNAYNDYAGSTTS